MLIRLRTTFPHLPPYDRDPTISHLYPACTCSPESRAYLTRTLPNNAASNAHSRAVDLAQVEGEKKKLRERKNRFAARLES